MKMKENHIHSTDIESIAFDRYSAILIFNFVIQYAVFFTKSGPSASFKVTYVLNGTSQLHGLYSQCERNTIFWVNNNCHITQFDNILVSHYIQVSYRYLEITLRQQQSKLRGINFVVL